jgi:hypothetical protein
MARYRNPAPAIPFILLHGTIDLEITTTPTALTWDNAQFITSDFAFTDDGTRVTINKGGEGLYMLYLNAGVEKKTGNPTHCEFIVYKNGIETVCCHGHSMIGAGSEHSDVALISCLQLAVGDYVEIYASVDAGTGNLEEDTARLILEGLPTKGWDNNHGGLLRIRGGVDR